jgi:hypothetical protein
MAEEQKRILQMLAEGKITVDEASRLLYLVGAKTDEGTETSTGTKAAHSRAKFLYVKVEPKEGGAHAECKGHERVNIRVPVALVRAGVKLTALMPPHVADEVNHAMKEKGVGFDVRNLKDEDLEQIIAALGETEINVDTDEATVRVYAE